MCEILIADGIRGKWFERKKRVVLNTENRTVTFENCFLPGSFWTLWSVQKYTCSYEDILDVHDFRQKGQWGKTNTIVIVTKAGKAGISERFTNFDVMRTLLKRISSVNPPGLWSEDPNKVIWALCAIFALIIAGAIAMAVN